MAQRGLALDFLKQIGKALLTGKNVMRMAIPIKKDVTDTRSQVQVLIEHLLQLQPLIKAAMTQGAARRDLCIEYYFCCLRQMALDQHKPFNPLMGETYQNTYSQQILGFDVSAEVQSEHIVNHPPTTLFSIKCIVDKQPMLTISGAATLEAGIWLNRSDVTRGG